jgi:predicted amidohydrolase
MKGSSGENETMRITSLQLEIKDRPKEKTLAHVLGLLDGAPESDLFLLPELWPCGYFSFGRYEEESETLEGPTVTALKQKAVERKAFLFMGSFVEREGQNLFNTSLLLNAQGEVIARYRKIHLFGYQSAEKKLLKRGQEIVVAETPWGKAGLSTCYDLRFPEFFRKMVDEGAHFFLVASAWPRSRLEAWILFNRSRAHENLAYLFSCNCVGVDQGYPYAGHSMVVDPLGNVVAEGGEKELLLSAEVDMNLVDSVRKEFSALNDRVFK